jgi:hypothetical protein
MEKYAIARDNAVKHMKVADHILTMTYPLVQDPKLLKVVMKNTFLSLQNTVFMLLYYERLYKRIPPFTENLEAILPYLKKTLMRYDISTEYVNFIHEIKEIMQKQTESDVEFIRKEKFVFASKNYDLNVITKKELKDYITKAKLFMHQSMGVIKENERRTGKL